MYFSMLNLIDRKACSFVVPDFASADEEHSWGLSLTMQQGMGLLCLMNEARWGKERMSGRIDRTKIEVLSMEEFNAVKQTEYAEEQAWFEERRREFLAGRREPRGSEIPAG
jgi:hypothetical protein